MATGRNALLARPQWVILNQLTLPLVTIADDGKRSVRGLVEIAMPITIFLDTLFNDKVLVPGGRYEHLYLTANLKETIDMFECTGV